MKYHTFTNLEEKIYPITIYYHYLQIKKKMIKNYIKVAMNFNDCWSSAIEIGNHLKQHFFDIFQGYDHLKMIIEKNLHCDYSIYKIAKNDGSA